MTRYQTIINLGDDFIKLMAKSLIPVHILDYKVYYEAYLQQLNHYKKHFKKAGKTAAVNQVAEDYNISQRTMFSIVAFMEAE